MKLSCALIPAPDVVQPAQIAERLGYERVWLPDSPLVYGDLLTMLKWGSWVYAMLYVCIFWNVYRLEEAPDRAPSALSRVAIEVLAVCMISLFLFDPWVMIFGANLMAR